MSVNNSNMLSQCSWGEISHQSRSDSVHWISTSDVLASTVVTHTTGVLYGLFMMHTQLSDIRI